MEGFFIGGLYNTTLLLSISFIYTSVFYKSIKTNKILSGVLIGFSGILIMLNPMELGTGIFFDARSILIATSGLFFGAIPTIIAMLSTIIYRIYIGGVGVFAGVIVIILAGIIGLIWRKYYYEKLISDKTKYKFLNIYLLGWIVHIVVLVSMLTLGKDAIEVINITYIPILVIFPLGTAYLGLIIRMQVIKQNEHEALIISENRYRLLVTEMKQGLSVNELIFDEDDNAYDFLFIETNKRFEKIVGCNSEEIIGKTFLEVFPNEDQKIIKRYGEAIKQKKSFRYEMVFNKLNKYFEVIVYGIGENKFVLMLLDTTERYEREKNIEYLSFHDQLTGQFNRRYFEKKIIELQDRKYLPLSVIIGDVNNLKLINDAFGQDTGDFLLKETTRMIHKKLRTNDSLSRIGGDEFAILLPNTDSKEGNLIIEKINKALEYIKINEIETSVSFGIATKDYSYQNTLGILRDAENDMYKNKLLENYNSKGNMIDTIMNTLYIKNKREKEHSERVSEYCTEMGKALKLKRIEINELKTVGLLHDIGKIALDESILNKEGNLTENEWMQMKSHVDFSFRILSSVNNLKLIAEYALSHHERWDGKGYPKGLKEEEIPYPSRIVNIIDSYDAMTSERTYKKSKTKDEAIDEIIRNKGKQFDPELADIFIQNVLLDEKSNDLNKRVI